MRTIHELEATTATRRPRGVRSLIAPPSESVYGYLIPGEQVLHIDAPALNAFLVEELPVLVVIVVAGIGAAAWSLSVDNLFLAGIAMIVAGALLFYLRAKRYVELYTAYVLTSVRVMKVSGFFSRRAAWIPWVKVTDVRYEASLLGRMFGYATVYIDSANETSGLDQMKNLNDPRAFYLMLTELVQLKQGSLPTQQTALLSE